MGHHFEIACLELYYGIFCSGDLDLIGMRKSQLRAQTHIPFRHERFSYVRLDCDLF